MHLDVTYNRHKLLAELDTLISANPRIHLYDVARVLGVDRHTIDNAIQSEKKMTFREFKRYHLLRAAKTMLDQRHLSVKEIGIKLGYASAASFSRFIYEATGKRPGRLKGEGAADKGSAPRKKP